MSKRKEIPSAQMGFQIIDNKMLPGSNLADVIDQGGEVIEVLQARLSKVREGRGTRGRKKGPEVGVVIDSQSGHIFEINTDNGQVLGTKETDNLGGIKPNFYNSSVLIKGQEPTDENFKVLKEIRDAMAPNSPALLLRRGGEVFDDLDLDKLEELELVERYAYKKPRENFVEARSRTPKKRKSRPEGVDLTDSNKYPRAYHWGRRLATEMVRDLGDYGFRVVKWDPLLANIKNSTNPPKDLRNIRDGHGITVKGPCGICEIIVDPNGNQHVQNSCGEAHDTLLRERGNKNSKSVITRSSESEVTYRLGDHELNTHCSCGRCIRQSVWMQEVLSGKKIRIGEDISCPSCGLIRHKKYVIKKSQLESD